MIGDMIFNLHSLSNFFAPNSKVLRGASGSCSSAVLPPKTARLAPASHCRRHHCLHQRRRVGAISATDWLPAPVFIADMEKLMGKTVLDHGQPAKDFLRLSETLDVERTIMIHSLCDCCFTNKAYFNAMFSKYIFLSSARNLLVHIKLFIIKQYVSWICII